MMQARRPYILPLLHTRLNSPRRQRYTFFCAMIASGQHSSTVKPVRNSCATTKQSVLARCSTTKPHFDRPSGIVLADMHVVRVSSMLPILEHYGRSLGSGGSLSGRCDHHFWQGRSKLYLTPKFDEVRSEKRQAYQTDKEHDDEDLAGARPFEILANAWGRKKGINATRTRILTTLCHLPTWQQGS